MVLQVLGVAAGRQLGVVREQHETRLAREISADRDQRLEAHMIPGALQAVGEQAERRSVGKIGCKRLVIDSLVGFEMALAPGFRTDFRESLYRMIAALTRLGVTIVTTVEVVEEFTSMNLSNFTVSFLADDIVRMRYVSINGQLRKMLLVVKMRRSQHSIDMVGYQITSKGMVIGEPLRGYRALTSTWLCIAWIACRAIATLMLTISCAALWSKRQPKTFVRLSC